MLGVDKHSSKAKTKVVYKWRSFWEWCLLSGHIQALSLFRNLQMYEEITKDNQWQIRFREDFRVFFLKILFPCSLDIHVDPPT